MKIRTGFVSNSSSSSFVAWGVSANQIEIPDSVYLDVFYGELLNLESMKKLQEDRFKSYYCRKYDEMKSIESDEEKVSYAKENFGQESIFGKGDFELGGQENDFVGIGPCDLVSKYPDLKFGEVKIFVASKLNETFGTNFTAQDISYVEEGWYNG